MSFLKKIVKKVNETQQNVIKAAQDGVVHAANEATQEVNKVIDKPVEVITSIPNEIYEQQKMIIVNAQHTAENVIKEATDIANDIIKNAYETQKEMIAKYLQDIENELKKQYSTAASFILDQIISYLKSRNIFLQLIGQILEVLKPKILEMLQSN